MQVCLHGIAIITWSVWSFEALRDSYSKHILWGYYQQTSEYGMISGANDPVSLVTCKKEKNLLLLELSSSKVSSDHKQIYEFGLDPIQSNYQKIIFTMDMFYMGTYINILVELIL